MYTCLEPCLNNTASFKEYKLEILENKKINVFLSGELYKEELSKYELLKDREIINSISESMYNQVINMKDSSQRIYT